MFRRINSLLEVTDGRQRFPHHLKFTGEHSATENWIIFNKNYLIWWNKIGFVKCGNSCMEHLGQQGKDAKRIWWSGSFNWTHHEAIGIYKGETSHTLLTEISMEFLMLGRHKHLEFVWILQVYLYIFF